MNSLETILAIENDNLGVVSKQKSKKAKKQKSKKAKQEYARYYQYDILKFSKWHDDHYGCDG